MNTYLLPVVDDEHYPFIIKVVARSYHEAQDKFMKFFYDHYDWELLVDWDDFLQYASGEKNWGIGEISDKDDF